MRQDNQDGYWIRRYLVRKDKGFDWGVFVCDSKGFLGIVSDYGNYSYHWSSFDPDFAKFLCSIDTHYLRGKLKPQDELRHESDIRKDIEGFISSWLKDGSLTAERAREELDILEEADLSHEVGIHLWMGETKLQEPWEWLVTKGCPIQLQMLCENLWPLFIEDLKKDFNLP